MSQTFVIRNVGVAAAADATPWAADLCGRNCAGVARGGMAAWRYAGGIVGSATAGRYLIDLAYSRDANAARTPVD